MRPLSHSSGRFGAHGDGSGMAALSHFDGSDAQTTMSDSTQASVIGGYFADDDIYSSRRSSIELPSSNSTISQPISPFDSHQPLYPVYLNHVGSESMQPNYYFPGQQQNHSHRNHHHVMDHSQHQVGPTPAVPPPMPFQYKNEKTDEHHHDHHGGVYLDEKMAGLTTIQHDFAYLPNHSFGGGTDATGTYAHGATMSTSPHPFYHQQNSYGDSVLPPQHHLQQQQVGLEGAEMAVSSAQQHQAQLFRFTPATPTQQNQQSAHFTGNSGQVAAASSWTS